MEPNKYSEIIAATAIYPRTVHNFGVAYAFLGIHDELEEVIEKETAGDLSGAHTERFDVVWYICALCSELNKDFEELVTEYFLKREEGIVGEFDTYLSKIKKFYRDTQAIDWEHMKQTFLFPILHSMFITYDREKFKEGLQENYEKLMLRREKGTIHGNGDKR